MISVHYALKMTLEKNNKKIKMTLDLHVILKYAD